MPAIDPRNLEVIDPVQAECLRRSTPKETLRQALAAHELGRRLVERGVRAQYPDWDSPAVQTEVMRRMHGHAIAAAAAGCRNA